MQEREGYEREWLAMVRESVYILDTGQIRLHFEYRNQMDRVKMDVEGEGKNTLMVLMRWA